MLFKAIQLKRQGLWLWKVLLIKNSYPDQLEVLELI